MKNYPLLILLCGLLIYSCKKSDSITLKSWSYSIVNQTEHPVTVEFYSKKKSIINIDTLINSNNEIILFRGSNDIAAIDNLTKRNYDSAAIKFENKVLTYTYNNEATSEHNTVFNILICENYKKINEKNNHTTYRYTITEDDYNAASPIE